MVHKIGPTASNIIFFDLSSQYWSQLSQIRCVGPTFWPSVKSYESQKRESLNWKYGPKNGTNSILDHIFRYFQFILVLTLSYQVCWSHFLAFCEKRLVAFPKRTKSGTNTPDLRYLGPTLGNQKHRKSMTLIAIGPNNQDRVESKLTLKLKIDKNVSKLVNIDKKGSFFLGGTCWYLLVLVGTCWYLLVPVGICWYLLASVGTCWSHIPDSRHFGPILTRNIEKNDLGCCWSDFVDHIS